MIGACGATTEREFSKATMSSVDMHESGFDTSDGAY